MANVKPRKDSGNWQKMEFVTNEKRLIALGYDWLLRDYSKEDVLNKYYDTADYDISVVPNSTKPGIIKPIAVIVHGRLFDESRPGYFSETGKIAYIHEDDFESLF